MSSTEFVQQRRRVERVEPEPRGDLLARRPRPLAPEPAQPLARLRPPPPILAHLACEVAAELRRADPRAQVVGRVEARVHIGEIVLIRVPDPGRLGQPLRIAVGGRADLGIAAPEVELELQLRRVPAEEERLEEDRRLRILLRLLVGEIEVLGVPARLPRDRLDDVRVDLRQSVVARQLAEGVGQARVDAGVVERVACLVQERLVVVQPALRARDQVDDLRRVGRDHARARRFLRPVVEVEPDPGDRCHVQAERLQRRHADLDRALLRVGALERRKPAQVARVVGGRYVVALRAEQAVEPALPQSVVRGRRVPRRSVERMLELAQRDPLFLGVARNRVELAGELGFERLPGAEQLPSVLVEAGALGVGERAELVAVAVGGQHGEPRLRRPQRQLLSLPVDARRENPVLQLVLARGQLARDDPGLAGLAQPVQQLSLVVVGDLLGLPERVELAGREEVAVALDDRGLLRGLLLAHAHGAALLGALEQVAREALLVLDRRADPRDAHDGRAYRTCDPPTAAERLSSSKGFPSTPSTRARRSDETALEPERRTTRTGSSRAATSSSRSSPSSAPTWMSSRITSGVASSSSRRASPSDAASRTVWPSSSRLTRQSMRSERSSSTTSTSLTCRPPGWPMRPRTLPACVTRDGAAPFLYRK